MGLTELYLADALDQVLDQAKDRIDAARDPGGLLEAHNVAEVRRGVLGRTRPDFPALAVTSPAATNDQARALHESWTIPIEVWSFVSSEEQGGEVNAILLALRGRSVLLQDRTLGLAFVEDVQSADWEALGAQSQGRRVVARARLNVRISIVEPKEA